jgi:hypothetical protein
LSSLLSHTMIYIVLSIVVAFVVIAITRYFSSSKKDLHGLNLPPYTSISRYQMIRAQAMQKGIWRFQQVLKETNRIANTKYGAVFRYHSIPFLFPEQYFVCDYKLASIVLSGDKEKNVKEAIKRNIFTTMNLIDRKVNSVFT